MSTTIKPEVYATWIPKGKIGLTPEIYAAWVPKGKVTVTLEVYATIVVEGRQESITADTSRELQKAESTITDTLRKVTRYDGITGDLLRRIKSTAEIIGDTFRKISTSENIVGRLIRRITKGENATADILRVIKRQETATADTRRTIGLITVSADTLREVKNADYISADTLRKIEIPESRIADTYREIVCRETITGDTNRRVKQNTITRITGDTFLQTGTNESIAADTKRTVKIRVTITADTERLFGKQESITADTSRRLHEFVTADTERKVVRAERIIADTVIRYPHRLIYSVENEGAALLSVTDRSLVNTFKDYGLTSFSVTLNERTLSDSFSLETVREMDINDAVRGRLLDYRFNFLVEETSKREMTQSVKGMYDRDELLYTQIYADGLVVYYSTPTTTVYGAKVAEGHLVKQEDGETVYTFAKAGDYLTRTAEYLGLTPVIKMQDFTPYNLVGETNITYSDLINSLFGWTSRVPQRQINVFIRDNKLYAIQRGMEENVVDITELPHTRPTIDKKLIRSLWNNRLDKGTGTSGGDNETPQDPTIEYSEETYTPPFSGTVSYNGANSSMSLTYENGYLRKEETSTSNSQAEGWSRTYYDYTDIIYQETGELKESYLGKKETKSQTTTYKGTKTITASNYATGAWETVTIEEKEQVITESVSVYHYNVTKDNNFYLMEEYETNTKTTYEYTADANNDTGRVSTPYWKIKDTSSNTRQTIHAPIGNSFYVTEVFVNGDSQGSTISTGKPGQRASQFTLKEAQKILTGYTVTVSYGTGGGSSSESSSSDTPDYDDWRRRLSPIADTSFPVREFNLLKELTNAVYRLNRKVEETVSTDLISEVKNGVPTINHIIDFTERIVLDGAEYYLVSNKVTLTPKKLVQRLQLIRWYSQ